MIVKRSPGPPLLRPPSLTQKVMLVRVLDGVQATTASNATWIYRELDLPELEHLGPWLESITVITNTIGATANHAWKLVTWWGVDGRNWIGPTDLMSAILGGGATNPAIQTPFTTTSAFGPIMRYALAVRNNAGTAAETAELDAWLQLQFKT